MDQPYIQEMVAKVFIAELERDAALFQLHEVTQRLHFLENRLNQMMRILGG
jgi:hypothetical protein